MFDLIALAFDADITCSATFMLNREDRMGISDTLLSQQLAHFFKNLNSYVGQQGSGLDNTIVLSSSGASTTHTPSNLPTLIAGGSNITATTDAGRGTLSSSIFSRV